MYHIYTIFFCEGTVERWKTVVKALHFHIGIKLLVKPVWNRWFRFLCRFGQFTNHDQTKLDFGNTRPLIRAFFSLFLPDECIFCLMNALPRHFWPISGIIRHPDRANWHAGQATHAGGP